MYKYLLSVLLLLIVSGCKESMPVYATPMTKDIKNLSCLNYMILDDTDRLNIQNIVKIKHDSSCTKRVELIRYYVGKCNNPAVKSRGSDFNGYIRVEIRAGLSSLYKVQSDFKHDEKRAFSRVVEKIKSDFENK